LQVSGIPETVTDEKLYVPPEFAALTNEDFGVTVTFWPPEHATACETACPNSTVLPELSEIFAARVVLTKNPPPVIKRIRTRNPGRNERGDLEE
jgi:hypothetical protein